MDNASAFISFQLGVLWVFVYLIACDVRKIRQVFEKAATRLHHINANERAADDK
jgi:hypothetical protein